MSKQQTSTCRVANTKVGSSAQDDDVENLCQVGSNDACRLFSSCAKRRQLTARHKGRTPIRHEQFTVQVRVLEWRLAVSIQRRLSHAEVRSKLWTRHVVGKMKSGCPERREKGATLNDSYPLCRRTALLEWSQRFPALTAMAHSDRMSLLSLCPNPILWQQRVLRRTTQRMLTSLRCNGARLMMHPISSMMTQLPRPHNLKKKHHHHVL